MIDTRRLDACFAPHIYEDYLHEMMGSIVSFWVKTFPLSIFFRGRTFGGIQGVSVGETQNVGTSALFADRFCGRDTKLIYYLKPGNLLSRSFTTKDTHSPRGDLLVIYGDGRGADYATLAGAQATWSVVGFKAPIFTFGTDLILPSYANADLRELLAMGTGFGTGIEGMTSDRMYLEFLGDTEDVSVPEVRTAYPELYLLIALAGRPRLVGAHGLLIPRC